MADCQERCDWIGDHLYLRTKTPAAPTTQRRTKSSTFPPSLRLQRAFRAPYYSVPLGLHTSIPPCLPVATTFAFLRSSKPRYLYASLSTRLHRATTRSRLQRIFFFPARHSRIKSTPQPALYLENLLQ